MDRLLDWIYARGMTVLLDIHTMKDSQNGFDNSGQSMGFQWTSSLTAEFSGLTTFEHWPIRTANWIGTFDPKTASYTDINYANVDHALKVIRKVVERYAGHPAVLGLEPLNEPWQYTPMHALKRFYWEGYLIVKSKAPYWKYIMHDSFRLTKWGGFMKGCPERALGTHILQIEIKTYYLQGLRHSPRPLQQNFLWKTPTFIKHGATPTPRLVSLLMPAVKRG